MVDAEGWPIHPTLTAGRASDAPVGRELLARLAPGGIVLADNAYDTDAIRAETAERGALTPMSAACSLVDAVLMWASIS